MIIRIIPEEEVDTVSAEVLVEFVAAENIPAYAYVTGNGFWADSTNPAHRGNIIGITTEPIINGFPGNAVSIGQVKNPAWVWVKGDRIFLNVKTLLTSRPITGDFSQSLGVALSIDTIDVLIKNPIRL